jgi:hypothetical protein
MKKIFTFFLFSFIVLAGMAQPYTTWTFDISVSTPSQGTGTISTIGGVNASFASGADNVVNGGYNTDGYPAQGTASGTAGVSFAVSTAGKTGIIIGWQQRHSNTASKWVRFQYTTDGNTWVTPDLTSDNTKGSEGTVNYQLDAFAADTSVTWYKRVVNLTGITAVENKPNFAFRVVSILAPQSNNYAPAKPTLAEYATSGTLRFDNVIVGANGILPVRLSSLSATYKSNNSIDLNWRTYTEANTKHFEIERSGNGYNFNTIAVVTAQNNPTGAAYIYTDNETKFSTNYYRLRIVDKDASYSYSNIVAVDGKATLNLATYPNPAVNNLVVSHPKAVYGATLKIVSALGQSIRNIPVQTDASQTSVGVSNLNSGTYIIIYNNGGKVQTAKLVKQ